MPEEAGEINLSELMKQKVDASLIGGFTVRMGDRLIDGSVARQLAALRSQMMQRD